MSSCPPVIGSLSPNTAGPNYKECQLFNRAIIQRIGKDHTIKGIIFSAHWDAYERAVAGRRLDETMTIIRRLRGPQFPVLIVTSVPSPGFDVPKCAKRSIQFGRSNANCHTFNKNKAPNFSAVGFNVDPADLLCASGQCRTSLTGGKLIYRDDNHLSAVGSNAIGNFIASSSAWQNMLSEIDR